MSAADQSIWTRGDRLIGGIVRGIELALALAFIFAVLLNFVTAVSRYALKRSIVGSDEVQIYVMIWMTFVGAAVVTWKHMHLRIDVLATRFPRQMRFFLLGAELVLTCGLTALLFTQSLKYVLLMMAIDRRSDLAGFPMWLPHSALVVGFGFISLMSLWRFVQFLAGRARLDNQHSEARL
jgi:TRAP-type C4-dicarboxylate transport system permease small subunit